MRETLRDWLPDVIQQIEPWVSAADISKGARWSVEIAAQLAATSVGLLCLTSENVAEPWLNFEGGALAKSVDSARVCPLVLDLAPSDVDGPLAQFQITRVKDHDDMWALVKDLNDLCRTPLAPDRLERAFEGGWKSFLERVDGIELAATPEAPRRSADDMLAELLERVRSIERQLSSPEPADLNETIREILARASAVDTREARRRAQRLESIGVWLGARVRDESMGEGTVVAVPEGGDHVVVDFGKDIGQKRFDTRHASLTVLPTPGSVEG